MFAEASRRCMRAARPRPSLPVAYFAACLPVPYNKPRSTHNRCGIPTRCASLDAALHAVQPPIPKDPFEEHHINGQVAPGVPSSSNGNPLRSAGSEGAISSIDVTANPPPADTSPRQSTVEVRVRQKMPKQPRVRPTLVRPPVMDEAALVNGVLLVDKPLEWTSFDVCGKLKGPLRNINVPKIGHAGTLDPMATGLLIVCTGKGTKWCDDYQAMTKVYTGRLRLGEGTASHDLETDVSERLPWEHITDAQLDAVAASFVGERSQLPPMFSAIKVKGEKLYNIARQGREVDRKARTILISQFKVWRDSSSSQDVFFEATVSKGTYVRTLAHDFGCALGSTAYLVELRREAVGDFHVSDAWKLEEVIAQLRGSDILNIVGRFRGYRQIAGAGVDIATQPRPKPGWKTKVEAADQPDS